MDGGALMYLPYAAYAGLEQFTGGVEQLLTKEAVPTSATRYASQYISDNAKGAGKVAYDMTASIANMAPSVALGTLNPALGSAAMFGSVYGNSYNSALHEGKDRGEAQTYATLRAVSETALQKLLGGISALGGKIPSALSGSIENINNAAYRIAAKYGKSILGEGSEEYLQEILQPVIRNLAFDEDNEFRLISEDAAYAGLLGALTAGVFETGNVVHGETTFRNEAVPSVSGARITDPESKEAQIFAESYYEEIRHYSTDAKKISSNFGISNEEALEIKNYLFVNNSIYDEELQDWVRFDPDCAIAHSWQRLMIGKDIKPHDRTLILHELYEMEIKKKHKGISHLEAHRIASKKYNYRKEAEKYYAGLKKYNKNR